MIIYVYNHDILYFILIIVLIFLSILLLIWYISLKNEKIKWI